MFHLLRSIYKVASIFICYEITLFMLNLQKSLLRCCLRSDFFHFYLYQLVVIFQGLSFQHLLICVGTLSTYMSALDNVPTPGNSWHGTRVRPKQIRFRFSAEFRLFWPKFGFAETLKCLSVSVSVSAETKTLFRFRLSR